MNQSRSEDAATVSEVDRPWLNLRPPTFNLGSGGGCGALVCISTLQIVFGKGKLCPLSFFLGAGGAVSFTGCFSA